MGMVVILSVTGKKLEIQDIQKLGNVIIVVFGVVKIIGISQDRLITSVWHVFLYGEVARHNYDNVF